MSIPIPVPSTINTIVITGIYATLVNEWNGGAWVNDDDETLYEITYNVTDNDVILGQGKITLRASELPTTKPELNALIPLVEARVASDF